MARVTQNTSRWPRRPKGHHDLVGISATQAVGCVERDQFTAHHHPDAISELFGFVEVVSGENNRGSLAAQPVDHRPQAAPHFRVESGGGLIEEQQVRAPDDSARQVESPPLTTRQLLDKSICQIPQVGHGQHLRNGPRGWVEPAKMSDRFGDSQTVERASLLRHDADTGTPA